MKRTLFAILIAAAAFLASCNNTPEPKPEPQEKPFEGVYLDRIQITNLGDMANNGKTHFIVQMSTVDEYNTIVRLMSAQFETDKVAADGTIPEGTYKLVEGDYGDTVSGSTYIYTTDNKIVYGVIFDGTINVKRSDLGYCFTVFAEGFNGVDGDAIPEIQCRYDGPIGEIESNRYEITYISAAYMGMADGVPYWNVQMATADNRIILLYFNTFEDNFELGIPTYDYNIQSPYPSPNPGTVDCTYEGYEGYGGSLVYVENEDGTYAPERMIASGHVAVTNKGNDNYDFTIVFNDNTFIPRVATYSGPIECLDYSVNEELETFAYLTYYGSNKWVVMLGHSIDDLAPIIYCFGPEGLTFEDGLASGTYKVGNSATWDVTTGTPYTIVPGITENNKYKGGSVFYTYDWSQIWDIVGYGEMDVVNHGDGTYDFQLALGGTMGNVYTEMFYSGGIDEIENLGPKSAPAKAAVKPAPFKTNFDRKAEHKFTTPLLPLR